MGVGRNGCVERDVRSIDDLTLLDCLKKPCQRRITKLCVERALTQRLKGRACTCHVHPCRKQLAGNTRDGKRKNGLTGIRIAQAKYTDDKRGLIFKNNNICTNGFAAEEKATQGNLYLGRVVGTIAKERKCLVVRTRVLWGCVVCREKIGDVRGVHEVALLRVYCTSVTIRLGYFLVAIRENFVGNVLQECILHHLINVACGNGPVVLRETSEDAVHVYVDTSSEPIQRVLTFCTHKCFAFRFLQIRSQYFSS